MHNHNGECQWKLFHSVEVDKVTVWASYSHY